MRSIYYVTGGAGFLGGEVVRQLIAGGEAPRVLVLPGDPLAVSLPPEATVVEGDLLNEGDLSCFLEEGEERERVVVHCAAIISMSIAYVQKVHEVNVTGTNRLLDACLRIPIRKFVYVSSVHALTELPHGQPILEQTDFSPEKVIGAYAVSKAEAANLVMRAARERGLDACLLHPAGITGPSDRGGGSFTQTVIDYANGRLPAGVKGGYSFSDVRDVAKAVIAAADKGRSGEAYILASHFITVRELFDALHRFTGVGPVRLMLPIWLLKPFLPLAKLYYRLRGQKEVFSQYALYTLTSNSDFDSSKAKRELHFSPRPFSDTLLDMLHWLKQEGKIKANIRN